MSKIWPQNSNFLLIFTREQYLTTYDLKESKYVKFSLNFNLNFLLDAPIDSPCPINKKKVVFVNVWSDY